MTIYDQKAIPLSMLKTAHLALGQDAFADTELWLKWLLLAPASIIKNALEISLSIHPDNRVDFITHTIKKHSFAEKRFAEIRESL